GGGAGHHRVGAARVVADHATEGAVGVGGGVGPEREVVPFGGVAQVVENQSGLHAGPAPVEIELDDVVHVAGKVDDDGHIRRLAGQAGVCAHRQHRRAVGTTYRHGCHDVVGVEREHGADRDLAVVGAAGRV